MSSHIKKMKRQKELQKQKTIQQSFGYKLGRAARQASDSGRGATLLKFEGKTYFVMKDGSHSELKPGETKTTGLNQGNEFIPFFEYSIEHGIVELRDRR